MISVDTAEMIAIPASEAEAATFAATPRGREAPHPTAAIFPFTLWRRGHGPGPGDGLKLRLEPTGGTLPVPPRSRMKSTRA